MTVTTIGDQNWCNVRLEAQFLHGLVTAFRGQFVPGGQGVEGRTFQFQERVSSFKFGIKRLNELEQTSILALN